MNTIILNNGNFVVVNSQRFCYNKCIFTFTIYQKDGHWKDEKKESFTIGYYNSIEDFILNNY